MSHIRKFKSFQTGKRRAEIIRESVLQVNDIYKVKSTVDIPQSLINAYVKKVKDNTGKNLRQFFGDMDIAEEIVKLVTQNGLDSEKISATALVGGSQTQPQTQVQTEPQAQTQGQAQPPAQVQTEQPAQDFEEVQPSQAQDKPQVQVQNEQPAKGQGQSQDEEETEEEETEEEDGEELPA